MKIREKRKMPSTRLERNLGQGRGEHEKEREEKRK